jgi:hypothetical protein
MKSFQPAFALLPAMLLLAAPMLSAQQLAPSAPVPASILTAQKVFIANAGTDAFTSQVFKELGVSGTDPYNIVYAAVKSWGKYHLVSTPADAEMVFEIRVTAALTEACGRTNWDFERALAAGTPQFQTELTIRDARTQSLLWIVTEPVHSANLKGTWRKNIAEANSALAEDLKTLVAPAGPTTP